MDDLISRQAAIETLRNTENHAYKCYAKGLARARDVIAGLPSVQPERKKGNWDTHDVVKILASGKVLDGFMQCMVCGCIFENHSTEYYFCPNCGADMR